MHRLRDPFETHVEKIRHAWELVHPIEDRTLTLDASAEFSTALENAWIELLLRDGQNPLRRMNAKIHPLTLPLASDIDGEVLGAALALLKRRRAEKSEYGVRLPDGISTAESH